MKKYNLILVIIFFVSCNSDNQKGKVLLSRIIKIDQLRQSQNINTVYLNSLDDSLNIIKVDLLNESLNEVNKSKIINAIDSVKKNIFLTRLNKVITGNTYSYESPFYKMKRRIGSVKDLFEDEIKENIDFKIIDKKNVLITKHYYSQFVREVWNDGYLVDYVENVYGGTIKIRYGIPSETEFGTYNYIGEKKFQISNGFILQIDNEQNGEVKIYKK